MPEGAITPGTVGSAPPASPAGEPGSPAEKPTTTPSTQGQPSDRGPIPYDRFQEVVSERNKLRAQFQEALDGLRALYPYYEEAQKRKEPAESAASEAEPEDPRFKALEAKLEGQFAAKEAELADHLEAMTAEQTKAKLETDYPDLMGDDRTKRQLVASIINSTDAWEREHRKEASPRQRITLALEAAKELREFLSGHVTAEFERRQKKTAPPAETGAAGAPPRGSVPDLPARPTPEQIAGSLKAKWEKFVGR